MRAEGEEKGEQEWQPKAEDTRGAVPAKELPERDDDADGKPFGMSKYLSPPKQNDSFGRQYQWF